MLKQFAFPAVLVICLVCPAASARAQSTFGAVVGVVTDSSAGVLPGATVTLTEVQTNVVRATATNETGSYEFLHLTQGLYRVEIALASFTTFSSEPFRVDARRTVRIDAALRVAGLSEDVTVRSSAPLMNTETPTVDDRTSNRELQELPFTFRTQNTSPLPAIQKIPEVQLVNRQVSLSGSLPYQNEVAVDGILTTSARRNGIGDDAVNIFPSIESIEEIKVSSVNNTAEFAQIGDITTISRSGTNDFHGTLFWNYNGTELNANPNYFNKSVAPNESANHNIGASLGGPLRRSRTFFFGTFERLDIGRTKSTVATVPSDAFRRGDFSSLSAAIIDPATGGPFPGNVIPSSRISAVAARLLEQYIPPPNEGGLTHRYSLNASEISNQFDIRLDQNFAPGHTIFGRLSWKKIERVSPTVYESLGPRTEDEPNRTLAVADSYALTPTLLNEARFGFTSADDSFVTGREGVDVVSDLGLNLLAQRLPGGTGTPYIDIAGYTRLGESQEEPLTQDTWQFADTLTFVRDRHTFKGGFDMKWFNWTSPLNFTGADDFGVFRFNNNLQGGGAGHPMANFLLGLPTEVDQTASGSGVDGVAKHYGFFVQDDWRVSANLTLSLGLRYDLYMPFNDREGNITNFLRDTAAGDVVVPDEASRELAAPGFVGSIGDARILTAAEAGLPESLRRTDTNNLAPRLGIAWRPGGDNQTVVRAGWGLYHTRILGAVFNSLTGIHTSDNVTFSNAFDPASRTYAIVWPNTFAGDPSRGVGRVGTQNFSTGNDPNFKDPQTQQWSLTVERQLNDRNALRATYSGLRSTNLTMAPDLNQIQPNTTGFANLPREARPFPNWNKVNTRDNGGYHNYHDVVLQLRGDIDRWGLSHVTSYKWAHSIDNIEDRGSGQGDFQSEINGRTDNRFDEDYLRGKTTNIPDHRFVGSFIWNLPFGRDRAFASNLPRALDLALGGWTVSSIVQVQSGPHLTAYYSSHCGSGTNCYGSEKADAVGGQDPNSGPKTLDAWFNTAAFTTDPFFEDGRPIFAGRFGNAEKGAITGPGAWNVDFAAFKDFRLSQDALIRFNVFVTNLFNHANWGRPNTDLSSGNYGRITTLNDLFPLRTIVLGARVIF